MFYKILSPISDLTIDIDNLQHQCFYQVESQNLYQTIIVLKIASQISHGDVKYSIGDSQHYHNNFYVADGY